MNCKQLFKHKKDIQKYIDKYDIPFQLKTSIPFLDDLLDDTIIPHLRISNCEYVMEEYNILSVEILLMTPEEYIMECVDGFNTTYDKLIKSRDMKLVNKYMNMMLSGTNFDMPYLRYSWKFEQEGLHRAMAVMKIDEEMPIPVLKVIE